MRLSRGMVRILNDRYFPHGGRDNAGRWYPMDDERQECCSGIREPSGRYPWSLWQHCNSGIHIRVMFGRDDLMYIHPELVGVYGVLVCSKAEVVLKVGVDIYLDRIIEQRVREGW